MIFKLFRSLSVGHAKFVPSTLALQALATDAPDVAAAPAYPALRHWQRRSAAQIGIVPVLAMAGLMAYFALAATFALLG